MADLGTAEVLSNPWDQGDVAALQLDYQSRWAAARRSLSRLSHVQRAAPLLRLLRHLHTCHESNLSLRVKSNEGTNRLRSVPQGDVRKRGVVQASRFDSHAGIVS